MRQSSRKVKTIYLKNEFGWFPRHFVRLANFPNVFRAITRPVCRQKSGRTIQECAVLPNPIQLFVRNRDHYFPMQNWLKIESSKSSVAVLPTISPTAFTAMRKSIATSSSVASARNASAAR